jgi:hypothetical protein
MYPANTHAHLELLKRMPANKFMARKTSQGSTYFVYADPNLCVCTYVGNQAAMDAYRTAISSSDQLGLSQKGSQSVEEDVVFGMENDDAENEFRRSVLGSDFVPGYVPGFGN